ncbi:hypothetical protein PQR71_42415, partial [Paraburkholderia fungorum]|uniref:hypothetical protein n=1 Tax=Paraburkholderia fungorum TaxID=134537 RepID=UPI0038B84491
MFVDKQGGQHIDKGGHWYRVKYDADNGTLRVTHPDDASKPTYPVRIGADGTFEVHGDVGLKGGGPKPVPREFTDELKQEMRGLFNEGKTHREVSEQLGLPLGQVRQFSREETARWRVREGKISDEKKQEILEDIRQGLAADDVAARTLTSTQTVRKVAKEFSVAIHAESRELPVEKRQQVADMLNEGLSGAEVSRRTGISESTVGNIGREYSVVRARTPARANTLATTQRAVGLLKRGMTYAAVADKLGVSKASIHNIAHENHIVSHPKPRIGQDVRQEVIDRLDRGRSQISIAKEFGISTDSVRRIASKHRLDEVVAATFAGADPQQIEALASNLDRRMPGAPGSPQPGTSTGGETRQPAA